jgi:hypothetical protein
MKKAPFQVRNLRVCPLVSFAKNAPGSNVMHSQKLPFAPFGGARVDQGIEP